MARKYGHHTAGTIRLDIMKGNCDCWWTNCRKDVLVDKHANLSKREQKRILAATQDDMSVGVDYSLNKHNRWMLVGNWKLISNSIRKSSIMLSPMKFVLLQSRLHNLIAKWEYSIFYQNSRDKQSILQIAKYFFIFLQYDWYFHHV